MSKAINDLLRDMEEILEGNVVIQKEALEIIKRNIESRKGKINSEEVYYLLILTDALKITTKVADDTIITPEVEEQEKVKEVLKKIKVRKVNKNVKKGSQEIPYMVKNACGRLGSKKGWAYKEINDLANEELTNEKGVI